MAPFALPRTALQRLRRGYGEIQTALAVAQTGSGPRRFDYWLSGALLVLVVLQIVDKQMEFAFAGLEFVLGAALAIAVPWRRRQAFAPLMIAWGARVSIDLLIGFSERADSGPPGGTVLALLLLLYALCRWAPYRELAIGSAVALIVTVVGAIARTGLDSLSVGTVGAPLVVILLATVMRYRSVLRDNQIVQARLSERNLLARELHDSVAHYVSAIAVQAQAAQYVAEQNPTSAIGAMRDVEATANRAIDEMRRMVGVLRTDGDIERTVPSTSLHDLAIADLHPPVEIRGDTNLSSLPPSVAAAVYRVAQEAVTNARKHALGASAILVHSEFTSTTSRLLIVNDGGSPPRRQSGGYGLIGMEERVAALGGTLEVGPVPNGGWRVEAVLPLVLDVGNPELGSEV